MLGPPKCTQKRMLLPTACLSGVLAEMAADLACACNTSSAKPPSLACAEPNSAWWSRANLYIWRLPCQPGVSMCMYLLHCLDLITGLCVPEGARLR